MENDRRELLQAILCSLEFELAVVFLLQLRNITLNFVYGGQTVYPGELLAMALKFRFQKANSSVMSIFDNIL